LEIVFILLILQKLLEFEYSFQGGILRFIRRVYKFLRGRRGTTSLYDDALGDARVHFDQHVTDSDEVPGIGGRVPGKLSLFSSVLKYVVKNPAGSVRSFSLVRLKRATAVFFKSDADDLDVWVSSRFPKTSNTNSAQNAVDPNNLDPKLDGAELEFPFYAQPAISIVIPVYNDYRMTMYCLTALVENTHGVTYEVIVGDDCSTDLTVSIAERVSNVTIVRNDNNVGFVENCRAGAAIARGDHILFLNNDTGVCENWLAPLLEVLQDDESVGIVGPKLLFGDGRLQEAGGIVWQDGSAWNFGRMDNPDKPEYNFLREVDYISGACLLIRGTLWRQLGGFDQRYIPAYYEDTDIAFAAREVGYKVVYQPLSRVFHFEGVSNGTDLEAGTKKYQVSNHKKFLHKWREQLESFHFPNAESVFQARDRSRHKRCVMFVDHYVPHYDKDAGSRSTFMYVQLMLDMGYKVIFLGANYFPHTPYTETLQQMGVEVLVGEYMARNQDKWLKENAPYIDRIYLHRPHIAEQLLDSLERMKPKPPIIFFGHDLHYLRTQREQDVTADITLAKAAQKWQEREYAVFDRVDKIYYPSQIEVDEIHSKRPNLDVRAIPLYVLPVTDSQAYVSGARSDLLFVGGFNHPPNVDGISWFVAEVLPLVEAQCPGIKLHIVGSNANDVVMSLATDTVIVHGYLSDQALNELYAQVRQAIVPLRYGAGVKGKVLEAIQKNVPLVTTAVGAEGIPAAETVMNIADTAVGFAAKIVSIESGDQALLGKLDEYTSWLGNNFSAENARKIILEDFGNPDRRQ
jgi:GT2 family glycosyltransferase/glycosyltransferase involved in cell wall biosynthesis